MPKKQKKVLVGPAGFNPCFNGFMDKCLIRDNSMFPGCEFQPLF